MCRPHGGRVVSCFFFFFNDTATTEIYTLSLHDALPISSACSICAATWDGGSAGSAPRCRRPRCCSKPGRRAPWTPRDLPQDRKSTRLNSSHLVISYAVFCLKKKKKTQLTNARHRDHHAH